MRFAVRQGDIGMGAAVSMECLCGRGDKMCNI